jgi:hypothetical protein
VGGALVVDDAVVHLVAFPAEPEARTVRRRTRDVVAEVEATSTWRVSGAVTSDLIPRIPRSRFPLPGSRFRFPVPGSRCPVPGSRYITIAIPVGSLRLRGKSMPSVLIL